MSTLVRFVSALSLLVVVGCAKEDAATKKTEATSAPTAGKTVAPASAAAVATNTATKPEGMCDGEGMQECGKSGEEEAGGCNQWDAEAAEVLKKGSPENASWTTYQVTGMMCGGCERKVIAKIGKIDGVVGVEADAELGQVRIATSPKAPKAATLAKTTLEGLYKVEKTL